MKGLYSTVRAYILFFLLWILLFDFQRLLFSIHNFKLIKSDSFGEWIQVFFQSLRLDLSTAAYLTVIPFILLFCYIITQKKFLFQIVKAVFIIELLAIVFIHAGEINAYTEWDHKLNTRVFIHLSHPSEVFRTAGYGMTLWFLLYSVLEFAFGWLLFSRFFKKDSLKISFKKKKIKVILLAAVLPILLGIGVLFIRGGLQQIPININSAHYSDDYVLNDISINSAYFFGQSYVWYKRTDIGKYMSDYNEQGLNKILYRFHHYDSSPDIELLKTKRPNLVFIILESWTATVSHRYSGKPGVTPNFDSLSRDGVLFTNIYSAASTSERGNSSIFSGYLCLPGVSITNQPSKQRKLKSLNQSLKPEGYTAGYFYGGDLKYGNLEGYFSDHGFDRIHTEKDFPKGLKRGILNYYDADLYKYFLKEINQQKEPFLEATFTGSTHPPYDCPAPRNGKWTGDYPKYMNAVLYADESLGDFMKAASKEPWYKNTLFIILADHGHVSPYVSNSNLPKFYHIPMLFYGPALKDSVRGMEIDKVGGQADIAMTLLSQMDIPAKKDYPWSKNLLSNEVPQFALSAITRGFSWVTPHGKFSFNLDYQKYFINTFPKDSLDMERQRCDALLQMLYQQYVNF